MDHLHILLAKLRALVLMLISPGSSFSIYALLFAFTVAFAWLALRRKRRRGAWRLEVVARAIFSWRLLKSRSTKADLGYLLINTLALGGLIGWGIFSAEAIGNAIQAALDVALGPRQASASEGAGLRVLATLSLFVAYEFGYWLDHYLKHKIPFLWELHKTHHTAEVLTPLTAFRIHPLDSLIFVNIVAVCVGSVMGLVNHAAGVKVGVFEIDGNNVILVVFIYAVVQLQHSQFWIAFPGKLGRLLLSPAHHQIHHSVDPAHYNANLGSTLAVFDWAFGTLLLPPRESPHLRFGVVDEVADPHCLTQLLIAPVGNSARALARIFSVFWPRRRSA